MSLPRRLALKFILAACLPLGAMAQTPSPLKIVVAFTAGGGADQYVRQVANELGKHGFNAIVDNKPGASGILAADAVAKAKPDGQTVLISSLTILAINPLQYERLPYQPAKDFTTVSLIGYQPALIVGRADLPYKNMQELVAYAKAHPEKINRGSTGAITLANLAQMRFEKVAGIQTTHIPFSGDTPALQALLGGAIDIHGTAITSTLAHVKAGKMRVLGVMDSQRLPQLPEAPTFKEQGYDLQASLWYAMSAPAATPKATLERLNKAMQQVMADPEFVAKARGMGMEPRAGSQEEAQSFVAKEADLWLPIFKSLNLPKQ